MTHRSALAWAGLLGAAGVALGAAGAHAMRETLAARGARDIWETAVAFQMYHAAALLGLAGWMRVQPSPGLAPWSARLFACGIVLFSGSLYWFVLGGPHALVYVTPLGGLCLIVAWLLAALAALKG
ncbi:MAG TPA: DUF423 domain-containing protein [Opitutaceae bacterium]|jgi:uncharacterized membrane protein YgdD (TMEM256/DUF423 family)